MAKQKIIKQNYSCTELSMKAEFNLNLRRAAVIVKECKGYGKNVYLKTKGKFYDCKSIMDVITSCTERGDKLQLIVEGIGEQASDIAVKLYSALTSQK